MKERKRDQVAFCLWGKCDWIYGPLHRKKHMPGAINLPKNSFMVGEITVPMVNLLLLFLYIHTVSYCPLSECSSAYRLPELSDIIREVPLWIGNHTNCVVHNWSKSRE